MPTVRAQSNTFTKVDRAAKLMVLYPFFYIVLTLPLSAGRMWSMAHSGNELPNTYQCIAGAMIASSGFADALLYTLTRKTLLTGGASKPLVSNRRGGDLKNSTDKSGNPEVSLAKLDPAGITQTRTVVVTDQMVDNANDYDEEERGRKPKKNGQYHNFDRNAHSPTGSLDPIISNAFGNLTDAKPEKSVEKGVKFVPDIKVTSLEDASDDEKSVDSTIEHNRSPRGDGRDGFRSCSRAS